MIEDSSKPLLRGGIEKTKNSEKLIEINQVFKEKDIKKSAKKRGIKYIDLHKIPIQQEALHMMSWDEVEKSQAVMFEIKGINLSMACVEPDSQDCKKLMGKFQKKGFNIQQYICSQEGLSSIKKHYEGVLEKKHIKPSTTVKEGEAMKNVEMVFAEANEVFSKGTGPDMMNRLNLFAIRFRASDMHFQPEENSVQLRMRRDGQLYEVFQMSKKQYILLNGEIKRSAKMKANVKNIPQDGDYEFMVNDRKISVRVSSLPSKYGESLVLRVLDAEHAIVDLDKLGYSKKNKNIIIKHLNKEKGLILVTGPTGSGKTSTLYSCLNYVNQPEKKIITLEDPIEFELKNTIQSEIEEEVGYDFATGLRAILRQDPDIVMLGEIRDKDAAEIALQASLTGHLVLSTVHANDAISTIPRLFNMGLKPYILASGMELIIAQRLVRKLCNICKKPSKINNAMQNEISEALNVLDKQGIHMETDSIYKTQGCEACANTGYEGRVAIAEVLNISDNIRKAILDELSIINIFKIAKEEGFLSLKEDGISKVLEGKTTFEELWRVLV